jgi:hypothetical protein
MIGEPTSKFSCYNNQMRERNDMCVLKFNHSEFLWKNHFASWLSCSCLLLIHFVKIRVILVRFCSCVCCAEWFQSSICSTWRTPVAQPGSRSQIWAAHILVECSPLQWHCHRVWNPCVMRLFPPWRDSFDSRFSRSPDSMRRPISIRGTSSS